MAVSAVVFARGRQESLYRLQALRQWHDASLLVTVKVEEFDEAKNGVYTFTRWSACE